MEGTTFSFKDFLMKFIAEQPTVENMRLSDGLKVTEYTIGLFAVTEQAEETLHIKTISKQEQAQKICTDCDNLLSHLNNIKTTENPALKNISDALKRTVAFNAAVYATLAKEYSKLEIDNWVPVVERTDLIISKAAELGVTDVGNGVWDLSKAIDKQRGSTYFTKGAIISMIATYNGLVEAIEEKEAKAAEKAARDAEKEAERQAEEERKSAEKAAKDAADEEKLPESERELFERWRKAEWAGIGKAVDSLLATLETLYKSGIESLPSIGILINNGPDLSPLISAKTFRKGDELNSNIVNEIDSGSAFDFDIMTTIAKHIDSLNYMEGIDPQTGFPTYEALLTNKGTMRNAHLMFQTASIPFSGRDHNKNSIKRWINATKGMNSKEWIAKYNNNKPARLCRWSDVKDWYRWVIENTLFRYFTAAGLVPESQSLSDSKRTREIADIFIQKMKNVVSVSERVNKNARMETTELKLTTDKLLDINLIAAEIASVLNTGNAKDITCKGRELDNQVYSLTIVYDQKAANKAVKFAYEVIDSILASGNTPSWDNVLIGRKQSGDLLFWNFMDTPDAASCSYAIYAGSGAGKGNMTLTLMAAALADGRQLFYTDGKPDSGGSIAALAWKDRKEAYMFDGQPKGTGSSFPGILEEHPVVNGMRSLAEVTQFTSSIPIGIFTEHEATMFLGTCRYLRSLQLCVEILNARGADQLPKDEWQVWVFDEMTAMSENEREIRKAMGAYVAKKGYSNCFTLTKASKDNPKNSNVLIAAKEGEKLEEAKQADAGVAYIYNWLTWTASIVSQVPNLVKIGLRQADANIFLIFQKADWLAEHGGITTISMFATALDCRKIVGANGLAPQCGQYGNGYTMNAAWYKDYVAKGNGWWAMSHSSDLGKAYSESDVTIIKPYSIWGYRKAGDTTSPKENFFDYYVDKLSVVCRRPVSETLQAAYDYATAAVKALSASGRIIPSEDVKSFIYNVAIFGVEGADFDPSTLYDKLKESGIESAASHTADYNNPVADTSGTLNPPASDGYEDTADTEETSDTLENLNPPVSPVPTDASETPVTPPVTPVEFERRNDGYDAAREEQARAKAEQQAELDRLRELAAKGKASTPAPSNELADRLKNLSSLSGNEQQRAIEEMTKQIMAGDWAIHKNMPQVTREEAEKAGTVTAHDTAEVFSMKDGKLHFDPKHVAPENLRDLKTGEGGNYVNFPHPVLNNSFFETDNTRKLDKGKTNAWKAFVTGLIREFKGRNAITHLRLSANEIIVNGRLVEHGFLENTYISSLAQIADIRYLLEQLTNLTNFEITQEMLTTLYLQTNDQYDNPDSKKTNREFEEYLFMDLCPKLNKFIILGAKPLSLTRAQFVVMRKEKKRQQSAMYKALKQETAAKQGIRDMKKNFIKNSGGKYHMSDTQSRHAAAQKKYKGGRVGKFFYNLLDRIAPGE